MSIIRKTSRTTASLVVGSPAHVAMLERRVKALEEQLRAVLNRLSDDGK
jgi:hypothetical protein